MSTSPELSDVTKRLAQLVRDLPDHPAVVDSCDYIGGAVYSLVRADMLPFWNRRGPFLAGYKDKVAGYIAAMPSGGAPGDYWMSGYFVNSAMQRIAAAYDRVPKLVLGILERDDRNAHTLMEAAFGDETRYRNWKAVYKEMNSFKHSAVGKAEGRDVGKKEAIAALGEIVDLLDGKKEEITRAYSTP